MHANNFDVDEAFINWENKVLENENLLKSDIVELRTHLEEEYNSLLDSNLSCEEAFLVATNRIGTEENWGSEFVECNKSIKELRHIFVIFSGVLFYLFAYYTIRILVSFIYIISLKCNYDLAQSIIICKSIVYGFLILVGVFMMVIFFRSNSFITVLIKSFNLKSEILLKLSILTMLLGIVNLITIPLLENFTKIASGNNILQHYFLLRNFEYVFLIQLTVFFIIVYLKVLRKHDRFA